MVIVSVSGEEGCGCEELAGLVARSLPAVLITDAGLRHLVETQFPGLNIPEKAWPYAIQLVLIQAACDHNVVVCAPEASSALDSVPNAIRIYTASRRSCRPRNFDLVLNASRFGAPQMLEIVETAIRARGLIEQGTPASMAESEFHARLKLARHHIAPQPNGQVSPSQFTHPSERIFAGLLDFYRIRWEYEPRSFPLQWNKDGRVTEAFTPDFYLPEFDLYVELTTMKQSLVTRKNRKVRLLKAIYPHVNIQVFYQKDFQELVSKYSLTDRVIT